MTDRTAYEDAQILGLQVPPGAATIGQPTDAVAPSSAVVPKSNPQGGGLSPTNGSVHERTRQSRREDNVRILRESVHVPGENEVRVPESLMDIDERLMNDNARMNMN